MMIGYDVYDRFTMEHFPLRQRVTLTTKIYCWRLYIYVCIYYFIRNPYCNMPIFNLIEVGKYVIAV
jgi:hypothetical protein